MGLGRSETGRCFAASAPEFDSLEHQHCDPIAGKTEFAVAGAGAHGRRMVFSGANSLLEHVRQGFQVRCRVVDYKRRAVTAGVSIVEGA